MENKNILNKVIYKNPAVLFIYSKSDMTYQENEDKAVKTAINTLEEDLGINNKRRKKGQIKAAIMPITLCKCIDYRWEDHCYLSKLIALSEIQVLGVRYSCDTYFTPFKYGMRKDIKNIKSKKLREHLTRNIPLGAYGEISKFMTLTEVVKKVIDRVDLHCIKLTIDFKLQGNSYVNTLVDTELDPKKYLSSEIMSLKKEELKSLVAENYKERIFYNLIEKIVGSK